MTWLMRTLSVAFLYAFLVTPASADTMSGIELYRQRAYSEAMDILLPLARQGDVSAQFYVGRMYEEGRGIDQNWQEAIKWLRNAAESGHFYAQYWLAANYKNGRGVPVDIDESVKWLKLVAAHDVSELDAASVSDEAFMEIVGFIGMAELDLGLIYDRCQHQSQNIIELFCPPILDADFSVPHDFREAAKWYERAAEKGLPNAQIPLGVMLHEGKYLPKDNVKAVMWLEVAASLLPPDDDSDHAITVRNKALQEMSKDEKQRAAHLIRGWRPKPEWRLPY